LLSCFFVVVAINLCYQIFAFDAHYLLSFIGRNFEDCFYNYFVMRMILRCLYGVGEMWKAIQPVKNAVLVQRAFLETFSFFVSRSFIRSALNFVLYLRLLALPG